MPLTPMPHQQAALRAIAEWLRGDAERATIVAACGSGKTLISCEAAKLAEADIAVVCAPSLSLLAQLEADWRRQRPEIRTAFVCHRDGPAADLSPEELLDLPPDGRPRVIFSTYQSLDTARRLLDGRGLAAGLLVGDEAHRLVSARGFGAAAVGAFPARRRLYMTATPRRGGTDEHGTFHDGVAMEDTGLFGGIIFEYPFGQGIEDGVIADYDIAVLAAAESEAAEAAAAGDGDFRIAASAIACRRLADERGARRMLAVLNRVDRAEELVGACRRAGIRADLISGSMPAGDRERALAGFREHGGVLANVRCLSEGVDIPDLDGVIFTDPRQSIVDLAQTIGRAIRRKPDGRRGIIAVPVILGDEAGFEAGEVPEGYAVLAGVLGALRRLDHRLEGRAAPPPPGRKPGRQVAIDIVAPPDAGDLVARLGPAIRVRLLGDVRLWSTDDLVAAALAEATA